MKITAVTTIAQHYLGAEMHLRNLLWAVPDAQVIVQHFDGFKIPHHQRIHRKPVESSPQEFFFFWDRLDLQPYLDSDLFVFTEQDIFSTAPLLADSNSIKLSFDSNYLSLFKGGQKVYPRIWEGYTAVPGWVIRKAYEEGVSLGNHRKAKLPIPEDLQTLYKGWMRVRDYVYDLGAKLHEGDFDTMFEFTIYCYLNNIPWESACIEGYHVAHDAVHFRGIDRLCFDCPDIYRDLGKLGDPAPHKHPKEIYQDMINDCAFLLLMSAYQPSEEMGHWICHPSERRRLRRKVELLARSARHWMTKEEYEKLGWVRRQLGDQLC